MRIAKRYGEAAAASARAMEIDGKHRGFDHPYVTRSRVDLGRSLLKNDDPKGAEMPLKLALDARVATLPPGDWRIAEASYLYGTCCHRLGRNEEAEKHLLEALTSLRRSIGDDHRRTQEALKRTLELFIATGDDRAKGLRELLVSEKVAP